MSKSVVERLTEEIYNMPLKHGQTVLCVSIHRSRVKPMVGKYDTPTRYTAIAKLHAAMDVEGYADTPEAALDYLMNGLIFQHAPDYVSKKDYVSLVISGFSGTGETIAELGRLDIPVPDSISSQSPCGCVVTTDITVTDEGDCGGLNIVPTFNWCGTHERAFAMRRFLERERSTTKGWVEYGDLGIRAIMAGTSRIRDIDEVLGEIG